jgi:GT2 family glycosyltransferase
VSEPRVGIVVVNYNSAHFIGEFLDSIRLLDYPAARLVIVDAASSDGSTAEIARRCPEAHVIYAGENTGTAMGFNVGARYCRQQGYYHVLFLNNDTTHEPDFLRVLVQAAGDHTLAVPRILYSYDRRLISTHAGGFDWTLGLFRNTYHGKPDGPATRQQRELQTASFCCALVPLAAFEELGELDERFFMYYEETDFIRRALERGYRLLYVPDAVIYHQESASSGGGWMTPFKHYYATRNRLYLVHKHAVSRVKYAYFTTYFWATRVPYVFRYVLSRDWTMLKAMSLAIYHYYTGKMGRTVEVHDL